MIVSTTTKNAFSDSEHDIAADFRRLNPDWNYSVNTISECFWKETSGYFSRGDAIEKLRIKVE